MEMEIVAADGKEMDMEIVPETYRDIISGDFVYDPVRLPVEQDPTQHLYDRKTLQTIWETERHARNPFTRQWFDIRSVIPQTELRNEMKNFAELHGFPAESVIGEYSKVLDEGQMKKHLMTLHEYVEGNPITEKHWMQIWKKINILRLFCEFHYNNIKLFISLKGFTYFGKAIVITIRRTEAKEVVGKEIVRAIDVIINGLKSGVKFNVNLEENSTKQHFLVSSLICIVGKAYNNKEGYIKIKSLALRVFSAIFHDIPGVTNITLGNGHTVVVLGYHCAVNMLCETNAKDISSGDLNHGIAILRTVRVALLNFQPMYMRALGDAVIICISRELERSEEISGFAGVQLLEFQMQERHNSEALEKGVRLIRDIAMEEAGKLGTYILRRALDIVKDLVHMFHRFNEEEGNSNCQNNCEMVQCVHFRIAEDGLDISEAIGRKEGDRWMLKFSENSLVID